MVQAVVVLTTQLVERPRAELVVTDQKDATGLDHKQSNVIHPAEDLWGLNPFERKGLETDNNYAADKREGRRNIWHTTWNGAFAHKLPLQIP